jgi:hypothetical protein
MRRSVPSAVIGQASPAVARARWGFVSKGRRRGSATGRSVCSYRVRAPEVDERGVPLALRVRTGLTAANLLHLSKGLNRSPGSRLRLAERPDVRHPGERAGKLLASPAALTGRVAHRVRGGGDMRPSTKRMRLLVSVRVIPQPCVQVIHHRAPGNSVYSMAAPDAR